MDSKVLRLVFLIGSLKKGGAERNLAKVASYAASLGHKVTVMMFDPTVEFELHPSVELVDLKIGKHAAGSLKPLLMWWRVTKAIWSRRPHKAIAFTRLSSQFLAASLYPSVIARYDIYPFYMKKRRWISSVLLFNLPTVKTVIAPSSELAGILTKYFMNAKKIRVISNPVAKPTEAGNAGESQRPYIVFAGRLTSQKRVDLLIKAFAAAGLKDRFDLVILGDGPLMQQNQQLAADLDIESFVQFKGFINKPYGYIKNAYCLVLTSLREGFPNVLVEALSLGTPVVSSDCPTGPKEIVTHRVNGLLFSNGNEQDLIECLSDICNDRSLYNTLKANAITSVEKFEEANILKYWHDVLLH